MGTVEPSGETARVNLAKERDFRLGPLTVSPSTSEIRLDGGQPQRVEPKVMEVLTVLARAMGQTVTRDELVEACWGGRIVSDDAINRIIAKVRLLARNLEPPPFTLDTVPKIGFRLVANESAQPASASSTVSTSAEPAGARWSRIRGYWPLTAVVIVSLTAWAMLALSGPRAPAAPEGNVDIVLLQADQNDPELAPLSLRIGEAIVFYLTQAGVPTQQRPLTPDLAVASQAEFRVAGTLHRVGDEHVVNGQVIESASGVVLWSLKIGQPKQSSGLDELFGSDVASVLKCALEERKAAGVSMSTDVLALFSSACDAALRQEVDLLVPARRLAAAAPEIAGAHGFHALGAAIAAAGTNKPEEIAAYREETRDAVERALAIDPSTPRAHIAIAHAQGNFANWLERERHINAALEVQPDMPLGLASRTVLLREVGRLTEAAITGNRSIRMGDPRTTGNLSNVGFLNAMTGNREGLDDVKARLESTGTLFRNSVLWTIAVWWEDPAATLKKLPSLRNGAGSDAMFECFDAYLRRLVETRTRPIVGLPAVCDVAQGDWRIRMLARQGDVDSAWQMFGEPLQNEGRVTYFLFYPEMKAFRQDPRFMPLVKRIGLLDYWRKSGNWPDFCSEPDLPYDCRTWAS